MTKNFANSISIIEAEALELLDKAHSETELEEWRIAVLGRRGQITTVLRGISGLDPDSRRTAGAAANQLKIRLQAAFEDSKGRINSDETVARTGTSDRIDVTLPGRKVSSGSLHPTTQIIREISNAFNTMGFQVLDGPEVELDAYNFQKLNIPAHHPARDMWNSLWIDRASESGEYPLLLRTHTSPMQIRVMEKNDPPIRVIVPGKAYRYEATDATHEWQFCQIEGLAIDRDITFADLKGTLEEFAQIIFGAKRKARFRCDFFPFVEPGAEMSIDCFKCDGQGCRVCGNSGWIEIMGAGMVHPKVLEGVGYDPQLYSGFAFGMGAERIAMLRHGIDDIRHFYTNDIRFLEQLK